MRTQKIALILLVLLSLKVHGQGNVNALNGYEYIYLAPLTYQDGSSDKLGFRNEVKKKLITSGLNVVETESIPSGTDACQVLWGFIEHTNNQYQATSDYIYLKFYNCKQNLIYSSQGATGAVVWTIKQGWNKALREALSDFDSYRYKFDKSKSVEAEIIRNLPQVEKTDETETSLKKYLDETKIDEIEGIYKSYQSDQLGYYKIGIKKFDQTYKAIILESDLSYWKEGEVKAVFEASSMKGFYSTTWYMGDKTQFETFALMENPALLSIEFKNPETGEKRSDQFIKLYPKLDEEISTSVRPKSSGSGFFITADGILATNAHVVENAESLEVQISNEIGKFEYSAKVLLVDNQNDVALIKIDDPHFKGLSEIPYSLVEKADIGEKVFTIGYPLNTVMGSNYKVTDGIVSSASGISDDLRYYQVSVPLQPGNSGGPLFNKNGDVIGITSAQLSGKAVGTNIENVNYAIKISYLINLYKMLPNSKILDTNPKSSSEELQQQVKALKNYVCLINVN